VAAQGAPSTAPVRGTGAPVVSPHGAAGPALLPVLALELKGIEKVYAARGSSSARRALCGIDLEVPRGSFFGLLGPNGAGKSTLINILAGLVTKSAGTGRIFGIDIDRNPRRARLAIGVVPQEINFDPFFTPREVLDFQAGLYGVPRGRRRTAELLEAVGLADKAEAHARSLSGGMRRRLLVAKALVHSPPVVVLDEPTAGVDVELRRQLWAYMRRLNGDGVTIVLTTHYLEEAEQLCDRIAIIDRGALVAYDRTATLVRELDQKELVVTPETPVAHLPASLASAGWEATPDGRLCIRYRPSAIRVAALLAALGQHGIGIADLATREADLEDLFVRLTHREPGPPPPA
jgi:ABC-2 type transport system ATP-binding protein